MRAMTGRLVNPKATLKGSAIMFHTFSLKFLTMAHEMALASASASDAMADSSLAVVLAATGLEAFFNEQLGIAYECRPELRDEISSTRTMRLRPKIAVAVRVLSGTKLDVGAEPYQSFHLLVGLRNLLIHDAHTLIGRDHPRRALIAGIRAKVKRKGVRSTTTAVGWEMEILNAACARWAVNTAVEMIEKYWPLLGGPRPTGWRLEKLP